MPAARSLALLLLLLLPLEALAAVGTVRFATGLASPVYLTSAPGDLARVFVAELGGGIEILDAVSGQARASAFLSLPAGASLYGLAFHPAYASNGYFFVYYQDGGGLCHLVRYTRSALDPDLADASSARTVLDLPTTFGHVGGWLGYGPDGHLYLQVGDSGDFMSHDAPNRGQSISGELLANVLRLDPDGEDFPGDANRYYAIPSDNPFVGLTGEDEIWAYGMRNPWRGSFDRETGDYYIADVGQDAREEIDFELAGSPGGRNYGWRLREGTIATPTGGVGGAQPPGGVDPIYDYTHGPGAFQGYSVTGGYVYRGPIAALRGQYFFGDFVSERIWSIRVDRTTGAVSDLVDWTAALVPDVGSIDSIVSFGEDSAGNLYLVDHGGEIFRIVDPTAVPALGPAGLALLAGLLVAAGARVVAERGYLA